MASITLPLQPARALAPPKPLALPRFVEWSLAWRSVAGFWALFLVYNAVAIAFDSQWQRFTDPAFWLKNLWGVLLSLGLLGLLSLLSRKGLILGLAGAALLALPAGLALSAGELFAVYHLSPEINRTGSTRVLADGTRLKETASGELSIQRKGESQATVVKLSPVKQRIRSDAVKRITTGGMGLYFFFFALGSFFVGMASAGRLREAEARAAISDKAAKDAQLRALRYQVNPHFLFNTLNSLSSLTMSGRQAEAETMILGLSRFLRSTLSLDPAADVPLSEEISLQRLYLDIERARFPERLRVEEHVPEDLEGALVPALILQPLIENAIKHGVARGSGPMTLRISATTRDGALELTVENDGGNGGRGPADGTGVGIANVCNRLQARHGPDARCEYGPTADGGYCVRLVMPVTFE